MAKRIDDHSFWAGKGSDGSVFPMGAKTKMESSADGAGGLNEYWDTTEKIKGRQEMGQSKIKSHPVKPGYTN
jgi:hypothetical protein